MTPHFGRKAAQAYLDDPRHTNGSRLSPRDIMDEHFQRCRDEAIWGAREAFLNMLADAKRFEEDVDGDEVNGATVVYVTYHLSTDESQFRELVEALGIRIGWHETTMDAVTRELETSPPQGIEAGTGETGTGSIRQDESPVGEADAPNSPTQDPY